MQDAESIGLAVGVVVAASLALQASLGPTLSAVVEALKATGRVPEGWSGVASLGVGVALGLLTGVIAWWIAGGLWWLLIGAFAGLLLGAGGVQTHHARVGAEVIRSRSGLTAPEVPAHSQGKARGDPAVGGTGYWQRSQRQLGTRPSILVYTLADVRNDGQPSGHPRRPGCDGSSCSGVA